MAPAGWHGWVRLVFLGVLGTACTATLQSAAQEQFPCAGTAAAAPAPPSFLPGDKPLPINLPTALQLANVRPIDVAVASQRIQLATAQLEQARLLWLPTLYLGIDYFRHDGQIQDVAGNVSGTSKSSFMVGTGPYAVFALSDAIFGPLAARQVLRAREAALQTAQNDSLLAVAEAYFNVQQARGDLAGAEDVARRAEDLVRRTSKLAPGLVPTLEVARARTQAYRSLQAVQAARERWRVGSADLLRILRLDPATVVQPVEPPHLRVTLIEGGQPVDDLIPMALTNRPELAAQQALVQASLEQLRQERLRPLVPSVLLRGASTTVTGTLAGGLFGAGVNDNLSNFGARSDFDIQLLWELRNLGLGNRALVQQRRTENQLALLELFRTEERIAAEVARAYAQAQSAAARMDEAEAELREAVDSTNKNLAGLGQTTPAGGNVLILVIRPQEVVSALQALAQAYTDFYAAVADYDRAQFRLYHALGRPAQAVAGEGPACPAAPAGSGVPGSPCLAQPGRAALGFAD
ncbi:MAG TPA: TolC family protein [Gemmataceae bacterium]|nr:TolC family protein [Gemmataceae bacterium]